jgi:hypothetical protein
MVVELRPQRRVRVIDVSTGKELPPNDLTRHFTDEAIGYYQGASTALKTGALSMPGHLIPKPVH